MTTIASEFERRAETRIILSFLPAAEVDALAKKGKVPADVVLCMPAEKNSKTAVSLLDGAKTVAWKHPGGTPVWAAAITKHPQAAPFVQFVGGPTGHLRWSESKAGFTIVGGMSHAEAIDWVAKNRVAHTYPLTAARMLGEIGGILEGICIDIGCGTGVLDIELEFYLTCCRGNNQQRCRHKSDWLTGHHDSEKARSAASRSRCTITWCASWMRSVASPATTSS